ncbi:MAG: SdrD B-like domain-containing protein [Acidobacteriota bacterium]
MVRLFSPLSVHRVCAVLLLLAAGWLVAAAGSATCPTDAGVGDVHIRYINTDSTDIPDLPDTPSKNKERNERARLSSALATKLGVAVTDDERFPQVRVITETVDLANGEPGTGIFSVFEIFPSATDSIEVYVDEAAGDRDSGQYRLFEEVAIADLTAVRVRVLAEAPSSTSLSVDGATATTTEHFCEPQTDGRLVESASVHDDKRFALVVPHGGEIEFATSEQLPHLAGAVQGYGIDTNSWDVQGFWPDQHDESEHWHITSNEVTADGFPGLQALEDGTDYAPGRAFQYVASLHGMDFGKEGMVLGGRAHREAKCLVASRVRERMAALALPVPAAFIWNYDAVLGKDLASSLDVPHGDGTLITDERDDEDGPGLSGTDDANLVNVLSPNGGDEIGHGGIQIEQSQSLRDDANIQGLDLSYRDLVAQEIGHAFAELITKPDLIQPGSTAICDALMVGDPAPTAEIHGRAWWDDGDARQNGGDPPVEGLLVSLYTDAMVLVATTRTDADGIYSFSGLAAGDYRLVATAGSGVAFVTANQGGDTVDSDLTDSDFEDGDLDGIGESALVTLAPHQVVDHVDAGLVLATGTGRLGDRAWIDADGDGLQGVGESGLAGVDVMLSNTQGLALAATTTAADGSYAFGGLTAGSYRLDFIAPVGYTPTATSPDDDETLDSDLDSLGGVDVELAVDGQVDDSRDAGYTVGCEDATLVAFGSEWLWSNTFEADWNDPQDVEAEGWTEAMASLGYGTGVASTIPNGGTVSYFRLAFTLEDPSSLDALDLVLQRTDGAIVYLNGQAVFTDNVPVVTPGAATTAATVSAPPLRQGTNVLAVEVHRSDNSLAFDLEMSARICRPCIEGVSLPAVRGTFLEDDEPDAQGNKSSIEFDGSSQKNGLIGWDVTALPSDAEVLHAELEVTVENGSKDLFTIYPMLRAWQESTADWFAPSDAFGADWAADGAFGPRILASGDPATDFDYANDEPLASLRFTKDMAPLPYAGFVVLNVSGRELVQSWIRGEIANDGLFIPGENGRDGLDVTADGRTGGPQLHLVYRSCTP